MQTPGASPAPPPLHRKSLPKATSVGRFAPQKSAPSRAPPPSPKRAIRRSSPTHESPSEISTSQQSQGEIITSHKSSGAPSFAPLQRVGSKPSGVYLKSARPTPTPKTKKITQ